MKKRELVLLEVEKKAALEQIHGHVGHPLYIAYMQLFECLEAEATDALIGGDDADNVKFKSAVATLRGVQAVARPRPQATAQKTAGEDGGEPKHKDGAYG